MVGGTIHKARSPPGVLTRGRCPRFRGEGTRAAQTSHFFFRSLFQKILAFSPECLPLKVSDVSFPADLAGVFFLAMRTNQSPGSGWVTPLKEGVWSTRQPALVTDCAPPSRLFPACPTHAALPGAAGGRGQAGRRPRRCRCAGALRGVPGRPQLRLAGPGTPPQPPHPPPPAFQTRVVSDCLIAHISLLRDFFVMPGPLFKVWD